MSERRQSTLRVPLIGLVANIVLATVKLIAGWVGHSHALVADAVESLTDVIGSLVVLWGLHIAAQPPDERHPYGHGKAEALATLIVSMMLIGAAVGIAVSAVREIISPARLPARFTLWILLAAVVIKEVLFRLGRRVSSSSGSGAVMADAWHHRSDAIVSMAAAVGISIAIFGGKGYEAADGVAALFASAIVIFNAVQLFLAPLRELMDATPTGITLRVREVALGIEGVRGIEKVLARKSGSQYLVDMHLEVDPDQSVRDAHQLAHRVKDTVKQAMPAVQDVLIHIEPHEEK